MVPWIKHFNIARTFLEPDSQGKGEAVDLLNRDNTVGATNGNGIKN